MALHHSPAQAERQRFAIPFALAITLRSRPASRTPFLVAKGLGFSVAKDHGTHKIWTACYSRHAIRIDASRLGVFKEHISFRRSSVGNDVAPKP